MDDYGFKNIEEDKIDYSKPGFYFCSHGRSFNIYFVENESIVIFYAEAPGVKEFDILVYGETKFIDKRYFPKDKRIENIPLNERLRLQKLLANWLKGKGYRHDISVGE